MKNHYFLIELMRFHRAREKIKYKNWMCYVKFKKKTNFTDILYLLCVHVNAEFRALDTFSIILYNVRIDKN